MKKMLGWLLIVIGFGGLAANIAFVLIWEVVPFTLLINSLVCLLFIYGGWRCTRPEATRSGRL